MSPELSNVDAERALLGVAMCVEYRDAYDEIATHLGPADWWHPTHALLWEILTGMRNAATILDPVLVVEELGRRSCLAKVGGAVYIADLYQAACLPVMIEHYARVVADAGTRRRVKLAGDRIAQRAQETDADPAELVQWAGDQVTAARDERVGVDVLTQGWERFIHSSPEQRAMVIPGLLGVGDRLVLTGHGGLGKSTLLQQIAVCAAAGLAPFDWHRAEPYEPVRVSILDFENPDHRVKTRLWPMVRDCFKHNTDPRPNLSIGGGGNPLNLLNPSNALSLLRTIEHDDPKILYVGPVYKMHNDDPDKEAVVKRITDVLDHVRAMGVSIITEAHHTKEGRKGGSLEPSGSNLWTWWPEFGLGLRLAPGENTTRRCGLERWRIDRESAAWPLEVESSGQSGLLWARADAPAWDAQAAS
jgi:replicative DNA helicase